MRYIKNTGEEKFEAQALRKTKCLESRQLYTQIYAMLTWKGWARSHGKKYPAGTVEAQRKKTCPRT